MMVLTNNLCNRLKIPNKQSNTGLESTWSINCEVSRTWSWARRGHRKQLTGNTFPIQTENFRTKLIKPVKSWQRDTYSSVLTLELCGLVCQSLIWKLEEGTIWCISCQEEIISQDGWFCPMQKPLKQRRQQLSEICFPQDKYEKRKLTMWFFRTAFLN